jgi:capsule polysaccharide export protein KpsE/RkpR
VAGPIKQRKDVWNQRNRTSKTVGTYSSGNSPLAYEINKEAVKENEKLISQQSSRSAKETTSWKEDEWATS